MKYLAIILLLLPLQILTAQPETGLYFGAEINAKLLTEMNNISTRYEILPPPDIYLHLGYTITPAARVDLSGGYIAMADNWNGFDFGISLKSGVTNKFYTSLRINYNAVSGNSGGSNQSPVYYKKNFVFGGIGAGYFVIKNAYVELNYLLPLNSDKFYGYDNKTNGILKLNGRLELGIGWNFYL